MGPELRSEPIGRELPHAMGMMASFARFLWVSLSASSVPLMASKGCSGIGDGRGSLFPGRRPWLCALCGLPRITISVAAMKCPAFLTSIPLAFAAASLVRQMEAASPFGRAAACRKSTPSIPKSASVPINGYRGGPRDLASQLSAQGSERLCFHMVLKNHYFGRAG